MDHHCFAACVPGLEPWVSDELRALGVRAGREERGGVAFDASTRQLYAANLRLRTATRVLVRLGSFRATSFTALERRLDELPWSQWLPPGHPVRVRASSHASALYHTGAIAERLHRVTGCPAARPQARPADGIDEHGVVEIVVRMVRDRATVSVDTSGEPLHRRGWRLATAKAPLRPTLAAAMLLAGGWDPTTPLVDPFCGSGTIVVEAARLARDLPPGEDRGFAFLAMPSFQPGTWASVIGEAATRAEAAPPPPPLVGADRDAGAVEAARGNAARAAVADDLDLRVAPVSALDPPAGVGWVVTNPPFGARVGGGDLRNLYARFGDVVRQRLPGWGVAVLAADRRLAHHTGLSLTPVLRTTTGGINVDLLVAPPA